MSDNSEPTPPDELPLSIVEKLKEFDNQSLRATIGYGQALLSSRSDKTSAIEAKPGEEILSTEDKGTYISVIKLQNCTDGCEDCPHGPYLYHVTPEKNINHEENYHWTFIGKVYNESDSISS